MGAGLAAGEAMGVTIADAVALKPGGSVPVHWKADPDVGPAVFNGALQVYAAENVHPLGAMKVTLVSA